MAKNITKDFGKYNIMLNSFVMFFVSDLGDQPFFNFLANSGSH